MTARPRWQPLALVALVLGCGHADPQAGKVTQGLLVWSPQGEPFLSSDGFEGDHFGDSVALSGDTAIVGAHYAGSTGNGAAYAFVRTAEKWAQQGPPLTASDGAPGYRFGEVVALSGDTALIGAPNEKVGANFAQGAAYVFVRNGTTWAPQGSKLLAADGASNNNFAWSVAIDGDTAAIGAYRALASQGAVYVFVRSGTTWSQQGARLVSSDGASGDAFGTSVALSGDTLVVGAPGKAVDTKGGAGGVYVFVRSGGAWSQQGSRLLSSDIAAGDRLGAAVSVSGDTLLAGAEQKTVGSNPQQGAAYVFQRSATIWTQQGSRLVASDGADQEYFGSAVALVGDTAAVGARYQPKLTAEGAAYVFVRSSSTWAQSGPKLTAGTAETWFGYSVALSSDTLIVGGAGAKVGKNVEQGTAYAFYRAGAPGDACAGAGDCANGFCSDGVCCDEACDGECDACAIVAGAAKDGTCKVLAAGDPGTPACEAMACNGVSASCAACAHDAECTPGHYCAANGACKAQVEQGEACNTAAGKDCKEAGCDVCATGQCADGVCCDQPCSEACNACALALTGAPDGECAPIPADLDPKDQCAAGPGYPDSCLADGFCDGSGKCRDFAKNTTACGDTQCSKGNVSGKLCDGKGTCSTDTASCAPYVCGGSACTTSCQADADCASAGYCLNGTCQSKQSDGAPCGSATQCASNFCTDGVCCEAACDGQCERCDDAGTCAPVTGEPQGGREACNGDPAVCGGTCDGQTRDACSYPSSAQACGSACAEGQQLPRVCDANGGCVESTPIPCGNYACGEMECLTTCRSGRDCAAGFSCDGSSCKPTGSKCSEDLRSSITEDEVTTLCMPYVCDASSGTCKSECTSVDDCGSGSVCDASKSCVPASSNNIADDGGCGCAVVGQSKKNVPWWLLLGVVIGWRRRRGGGRDARREPWHRRASINAPSPLAER